MDRDKAALASSLDSQRTHVLGILDGLTDEDLHRPVLPTGWSCLGLVRHLTLDVEEFWFQRVVSGDASAGRPEGDADDGWALPAGITSAAVFDRYRRGIVVANEVIASTSLDTPPGAWPDEIWPDWRMADLRAIVLHVITETACHAGHLDAARELIDGRTWMAFD